MFFPHDGIYETLVGTSGVRPVIKPLGIIVNNDSLSLRIYKNTLTFANLTKNNKCSIHITLNSRLFVYSLLEKLNFDLDSEYNIPVLKNLNIIFAECIKVTEDDPSIFRVSPLDLEINTYITQAYNRGDFLLIDLLVNYTRLDIYKGEDLERLIEILKYEYNVIKRTSPDLINILNEIEENIRLKGFKLD